MKQTLLTAALLLFLNGYAQADSSFKHASVHLEQNVTDEDVEVKIEALGGDQGMANLKVVSPHGKTVVDFKAGDSKMGLRHFSFESPEPKNDGSVQANFPEGEYLFTGRLMSGKKLRSKAMLNYKLPALATFVYPRDGEEHLPSRGVIVKWKLARKPATIVVSVEQEQSGHEIMTKLPGSATSFAIPDDFLSPNTEYKLSIGTVASNLNGSFMEISVKTDAKVR